MSLTRFLTVSVVLLATTLAIHLGDSHMHKLEIMMFIITIISVLAFILEYMVNLEDLFSSMFEEDDEDSQVYEKLILLEGSEEDLRSETDSDMYEAILKQMKEKQESDSDMYEGILKQMREKYESDSDIHEEILEEMREKHEEDRARWMEEKNTMAKEIAALQTSACLYRDLLHDLQCS